jgi:hypothetical protein
MREKSGALGFFKFLAITFVLIVGWVVLSLGPLSQLLNASTAVKRQREEVEILEQRVQSLERQIQSTLALGPEFLVQVRAMGMAAPYEKVIFLKMDQNYNVKVDDKASSVAVPSASQMPGHGEIPHSQWQVDEGKQETGVIPSAEPSSDTENGRQTGRVKKSSGRK